MASTEIELLEEMTKWLRFMGIQEARDVVRTAVDNEEDKERDLKIAYELTDGSHSTKDIEKYISYSYKWVSDRQQEWANIGIVEKEAPNSPYTHIMSLDELGIDRPEIPEPDTSDKVADTEKEENASGKKVNPNDED